MSNADFKYRPCPFCGNEPLVIHYPAPHDVVQCIPCSRIAAVRSPEQWNTRPVEDAIRVDLERAEIRCKSSLNLYEEYHDRNIELRDEIHKLKEKCKALEELVDCLEESADGYWREHDDKLLDARAKLAKFE